MHKTQINFDRPHSNASQFWSNTETKSTTILHTKSKVSFAPSTETKFMSTPPHKNVNNFGPDTKMKPHNEKTKSSRFRSRYWNEVNVLSPHCKQINLDNPQKTCVSFDVRTKPTAVSARGTLRVTLYVRIHGYLLLWRNAILLMYAWYQVWIFNFFGLSLFLVHVLIVYLIEYFVWYPDMISGFCLGLRLFHASLSPQ